MAASVFEMRRLALFERTPSLILIVAAVNTLAGLACWFCWKATGEAAWVNIFFAYPNAILTMVLGAVELLCSFYAWRAFAAGDVLRNTWLFLFLASATHVSGRLISQFLFRIPGHELGQALYEAGVFLGGPAQMFLMLFGLFSVARFFRRSGIIRRPTAFDYVLIVLAAANALHTVYEIREYIAGNQALPWAQVLKWPTDPLVIVLLMIAIPIHRSVASMGRGFIASCWGAYVGAIMFVSLGDVSLWLMRTTNWNITTLGWYTWFLADAAFALGPAYQVAAIHRARFRMELSHAVASALPQ